MFRLCFGGGQAADSGKGLVIESRYDRAQPYVVPSEPDNVHPKAKKEVPAPAPAPATKTFTSTFLSENNTGTSLSCEASSAYQLNLLNSQLAGLSGSWYDRMSAAASRLTTVSSAALCAVHILDMGHERFTAVHAAGKAADAASLVPLGSQLPALQSTAPGAQLPALTPGGGLRYNSVQVLQLLQMPLLYSFSDPTHASRETNQPPHDWQALYDSHGLTDFCALPLLHNKAVVGAVTLAFRAGPPTVGAGSGPGEAPVKARAGATNSGGAAGGAAGGASPLMSCDEQSMRTLGLLLSVLLVGQDLQLAQQIADILAGVYDARNLQQVVTVVTAGTEQVLQLTTRVAVAASLAVMPAGGLRAIFFEERVASSGSRLDCSAQGTAATRSVTSFSDTAPGALGGPGMYGSASAPGAGAGGNALRGRLLRSNTPFDGAGTGASATMGAGQGAGTYPHASNQALTSPRAARSSAANGSGASLPSSLSVRAVNGGGGGGAASASLDNTSPPNGSNGGLLWQQGLVQARSFGLRHTLLANLPPSGTVINDCSSYMQQVGCPKRDLYLLSTCQGAAPFSLVIVPAALKEGDTSLVLYIAVGMRLPPDLLSEIQARTQQLAVCVLAPLLQQSLATGPLAEEWTLLLGKCSSMVRTAGSGSNNGNPGGGGSAATGSASGDAAPSEGAGGGGGLELPNTAAGSTNHTPGNSSGSSCDGNPTGCGGARTTSGTAGSLATGAGASNRGRISAPSGGPPGTGGGARQAQDISASILGEGPRTDTLPPASLGAGGGTTNTFGSRESQVTVLSTTVGGAFAGDTRTHMGMLVASFRDTINSLQAARAEEAEELSVLKLGKVLGRGGSGLVFQGYLHLGLEVAIKLFENPDDTDPDALLPEEGGSSGPGLDGGSGAGGGGSGVAEGEGGESGRAAGGAGGAGAGASKEGGKDAKQPSKLAAQMTKRQRDLLRNALELGVTSSLSHPNIVQGYCHWVNVVLMQDASLNRCWLMGQAEYMALAPPGSPPPPLCSALVMEYCDMGSLIHALKRGTFTTPEAKPNMEFVYMCLLEIALALRHLHTAKLAHCDLKPGNVLLRSSPRDTRGFVCKLGDFGYAAILKDGLLPGRPAVLPEEACGTLQYMAPELFVAGRPVDASIDIYAFGMLMWELITGRTPYSDTEYGSRALMKAVYHGKRPAFPENTLPAYKNLAMCCWSGDPTLRPNATVLVKLLRQQLESLKQHSAGMSAAAAAVARSHAAANGNGGGGGSSNSTAANSKTA